MTIPTDVTGLKYWYKADGTLYQLVNGTTAATADNDLVGYWTDESGNAAQVVASGNNSTRPAFRTNVLNGLPIVEFTGSDSLSTSALPGTTQPITVFLVGQSADTAGQWFDHAGRPLFGHNATTKYYLYAGASILNSATDKDSSWHVFDCHFTGATSQAYRDGVSLGFSGNPGTVGLGGQVWLGAGLNSGAPFDCKIAEIFTYTVDVSGADLTGLRDYLSTKWNIAGAATGHPASKRLGGIPFASRVRGSDVRMW